MGKLAPVTPTVYIVTPEGKLYLFHTTESKAAFEGDASGVLAKAQSNWDASSYE